MQPSSTFTDDLVLPSRRQRWDVLLRFRSLPMNVTSLFIGVAIGKLLSGLLFPSLAEHEGCYVLWAMRAAVPLTSFGALLLFLACAVWELCVRDLSDHKRMKERETAWKAAIEVDESLTDLKRRTDELRRDMHAMDEVTLTRIMDSKPLACGHIVVDDAAAACALLQRRRSGRWLCRGRGVQLP